MTTFVYNEDTQRFVISHDSFNHVMENITKSDLASLVYDIYTPFNDKEKPSVFTVRISSKEKI
jgi:hypothetical protein